MAEIESGLNGHQSGRLRISTVGTQLALYSHTYFLNPFNVSLVVVQKQCNLSSVLSRTA